METTENIDFDPFSGPELIAVIPLTEAQNEIWSSTIMDKDASLCYNESFAIHFEGKIQISILIDSISEIISRHDLLRSTISPDGTKINIYREISAEIPILDAPEFDSSSCREMISEKINSPFDLIHGPLFRTFIFRHKPDEHTLLMMAHHIICDGWSLDVLLSELSQIYNAKINSKEISLKPATQFSEYVDHLQTQNEANKNSETYWKEIFSDDVPVLDLPADFTRPEIRTYKASRIDNKLAENILIDIKKLASKTQSSFFTVMLTAWAVQICRLTNQNDIVIGVPFAGQSAAGMDDLVGHCVSMLPILIKIDKNISFIEQVQKTKSVILDAFEHQNLSFGTLLQKIRIQRDPSRIPLISISFTHTHQYSSDEILFGDCQVDYQRSPRSAETFELSLNAIESENGIELLCYFNTSLFEAETIKRYLAGLETLIQSIIQNPQTAISSLKIISRHELDTLDSWNSVKTAYNNNEIINNSLIHNLFEKQSINRPDNIAAFCGNEKITFKELDEKSNQIANYLRSLNINSEEIVGISIERSLNMIISLLGILKAGCCYLPMDPVFPEERIKFMYKDSGAKILITQESLKNKFQDLNTNLILVDTDWHLISEQKTDKPEDSADNQSLSYIIYTSGSTGKPKGVKVHHQAVINFLLSMSKNPGMTDNDKLLAVTTLSFDISVLELFLPLITGSSIVIATENELLDAHSITALFEKYDITVFQATPATWNMLISSGWKGKRNLKALCGGEPISSNLVKELFPKTESLWNMYGPTETTVWSTCYKFENENSRIIIGKPIDNTKIFILDSENNIQPIGVSGEVCIGGLGVSKGYHNRNELTEEKFIPGPDNQLMYKTGDLGRFLNDGNIELFGRIDDQIKLRGFRIEPGEIEKILCQIDGISEAIVKIQKFSEIDEKLVAFIRIKDNLQIENEQIINSISLNLPRYMIPSAFVKLKYFPRTPNGKIDKKALIFNINEISANKEMKKPENEIQAAVYKIWAKVLKTENIGIEDNFFDLGGHSLLIVEMQNSLKNELNLNITIIELFTHPTIKSLTEFLQGKDNNSNIKNSIQDRAKMQRAALSKKQNLLKKKNKEL